MLKRAFQDFEEQLEAPELSMTPLIDMIFILLIFFVVTTTFTKESGIQIERAKAETAVMITDELLLLAISKEGEYWLEGKQWPLSELIPELVLRTKGNDKLTTIITPDKESQVEPLITLMDRLRDHDISRFTIGAKQGSPEQE